MVGQLWQEVHSFRHTWVPAVSQTWPRATGTQGEDDAALTQVLQTRGGTWAQTLTVGGIGNKHLEGALEPCLVRQKGFPQEVTTEVCL